jgi:hypothetical protein
MSFLEYLGLLRRHAVSALALAVLVVAATMSLVAWKNTAPYETTVFISIGNNQNEALDQESAYENVQAADHFSETVQGWFKNPKFQERIKMRSSSEMNARKQEKQNLVVTFSSEQAEEGQLGSEKLRNELEMEINAYNSGTNSDFQIAVYTFDTKHKPLSFPLFLIISIIGGVMLASFALYGFEYLFEKVTAPAQAAEILGREPLDKLLSLSPKKKDVGFLSAHLGRQEGKNIQIVGAGVDAGKLTRSLERLGHGKSLHTVMFPEESDKIARDGRQLVVCVLGKTSLDDLSKLKTLVSASFDLLIVEA